MKTVKLLFVLAAILLTTVPVLPQSATKDEKEIRAASDKAKSAANAFNAVMSRADKSIPRELLERAEAVAIFPGVLKAAFIVGGRGGEGIISRRTPEGWSVPAFFKLGGGSLGFQIGADRTDYIMLFMNDGGLKGLLEDKFEFGADAGVAAGPIGREASATTNATLDAGILSYSRSKGAFIGAALKGSRIAPDNNRNRALYGKTAKEILQTNDITPMPDSVKVFPETLSRYSSRKGSTVAGAPASTPATRQRTAINVNTDNAIIVASAPRTETNNPESTATTTPPAEVYAVGRTTTRPTNRLAREVRSELLTLPNYDVFDWLEFEILTDNTVVLRGQTTRPTTRDGAETVVKDIEGVTAVRNEIEVLPVSPGDEELRTALYRNIYSGQLARYGVGANQPIHIIVKNGRVALKGLVDSEGDKNYAGVQANGVSGVFEVKNELIIEGERR